VQTSLADTAAIAALTHCLARDAAQRGGAVDIPPDLVEEGLLRAARFGTEAEPPDHAGHLRPVRPLLDEALAIAQRHASELGCHVELDALPGLVERSGGAGHQRRVHEITGMDTLLRELTQRTSG
jgi:carboxylate-amine ligase